MNHERSTIVYVAKKVLSFLILYGVSAIIGEAIIIGGLSIAGYDPLHGVMPVGKLGVLIPYYGFSIFLLSAIIYCRFIEKRSIASMGFNKSIGDFFVGAGIAIVLLPAGSDEFLKHIVDECIYTNHEYNIGGLQKLYAEKFDGEEWIKE